MNITLSNKLDAVLAEIRSLRKLVETLKLKAVAEAECEDEGYYGTETPERSGWCQECGYFLFGKHPEHPLPSSAQVRAFAMEVDRKFMEMEEKKNGQE